MQGSFAALHDPLTQLPNRNYLEEFLAQRLNPDAEPAADALPPAPLAVLAVDIDRFKAINDQHGHQVGDLLLRQAAARLRETFGEQAEMIARTGSAQFTLLLAMPVAAEALPAAELARQTLSGPFHCQDAEVYATASSGVALFPDDAADAHALLRNAFAALHEAKHRGGNRAYRYDSHTGERHRHRRSLEGQLRRAIDRDELVLHYQPQVSLADQQIVGAEALVRWQHPTLGLIPPSDFIPLAEETGLVVPLGEWVLRAACRQAALWRTQGLAPLRLAVNISPRQFEERDLVPTIESALAECGVPPGCLDIEITETSIIRSPEATYHALSALREMGCRLSIDDFGTGYSSLIHLKNMPLHCVKIDQSFTRGVASIQSDSTLALAIIGLAHNLQLHALAEGVESKDQANQLHLMRCDEAQGFFFHKPMPPEELRHLLARRTNTSASYNTPASAPLHTKI